VRKACIPCRNAKVGCDNQRPCSRCVKHGFENTCVDAVRKQRLTKKSRAETNPAYELEKGTSSPDTTSPDLLVPPSPITFLSSLLQDDIPAFDIGSIQNSSIPSPSIGLLTSETSLSAPQQNLAPMLLRELGQVRDSISNITHMLHQQQQQLQAQNEQHQILHQYLEPRLNLRTGELYARTDPAELNEIVLPSYLTHQVHATDDAFVIFDDASAPIVDCSPRFAEILGYSSPRELLLGHGLVRLIDILNPKLIQSAIDTCRDAKIKNILSFERPSVFACKDGSSVRVYLSVKRANGYNTARIIHIFPDRVQEMP